MKYDPQLLDDGWHELIYDNKTPKPNYILIGRDCWIQSFCHIYKGVDLSRGVVLQSDSILRTNIGIEPYSLVAISDGFPIVIKENVRWK